MQKKILSIILTVLMLISNIPASARIFAEEESATETVQTSNEDGAGSEDDPLEETVTVEEDPVDSEEDEGGGC